MKRLSKMTQEEAAEAISSVLHRGEGSGDCLPFGVIQVACHANAVAGGWWQDPHTGEDMDRNVGALLMLIVTEIAEGMEGFRKNLKDDKLPDKDMLQVELADAIIRILDLADACGYTDMGKVILRKLAFNAQRADHKPENRVKENGKRV